MKTFARRSIISIAILMIIARPSIAQHTGYIYKDSNANGVQEPHEAGIAGVAVSDGLNVVKTGPDGAYTLPGFENTRFISVTIPNGYRLGEKSFAPASQPASMHEFGLIPQLHPRTDGTVRLIQVSDTETDQHGIWLDQLGRYARTHGIDFILHNGDICYEPGMRFHARQFNTSTMGVPVYYAVGNHDLVKGPYGEALFESLLGPTCYSFDAGNVHFVVTPMFSGDHAPSYTLDQLLEWLQNDLDAADAGKQVVFINHNYWAGDHPYTLRSDNRSVNLLDFPLKAWLYGHWHSNFVFHDDRSDVALISTAPPNKGGIDNAPGRFLVIDIDSSGVKSVVPRYAFLRDQLHILIPDMTLPVRSDQQELPITVQAYDSEAGIDAIYARLLDSDGTAIHKDSLKYETDWSWGGTLPLPQDWLDRALEVQVDAHFDNGKILLARREIHQTSETPLHLAWTRNVGNNVWGAAPLVVDNSVYIATAGDAMPKSNAVMALNKADGNIRWRFETNNSVKSNGCYHDGLLLVVDVEATVYALDTATGKLRWKKELQSGQLPNYLSGGVIHDGIFYVGAGKYLQAMDVNTGTTLWVNDSWNGGEGTGAQLTVAGDALVTGSNWSALYGHDLKKGKLLWQKKENGLSFRSSSGTYADGQYYIASTHTVSVIDPASGRTLKHTVDSNVAFNVTAAPLLTDKLIIVSTERTGVVAYDRETLQRRWHYQTGEALVYTAPYSGPAPTEQVSTIENTPVLANGLVVFGASDGYLYALHPASGRLEGRYLVGSPLFADAAVDGQSIYFADFSGNIMHFLFNDTGNQL